MASTAENRNVRPSDHRRYIGAINRGPQWSVRTLFRSSTERQRGAKRTHPTCVAIMGSAVALWMSVIGSPIATSSPIPETNFDASHAAQSSRRWTFQTGDDANADGIPDGWVRRRSMGYPAYVKAIIRPHDEKWESTVRRLDASILRTWQDYDGWIDRVGLPASMRVPLPPAITDAIVPRYLSIEMDGGRFQYDSPRITADQTFQYELSFRLMTRRITYDRVTVSLVFFGDDATVVGQTVAAVVDASTAGNWSTHIRGGISAPDDAVTMAVRLHVVGSPGGLEDIDAVVGLDDVSVTGYPQLRLEVDHARGLYRPDEPIDLYARAMGVTDADVAVRLEVRDHTDTAVHREVLTRSLRLGSPDLSAGETSGSTIQTSGKIRQFSTRLGPWPPGYYQITASVLQGKTNIDAAVDANRRDASPGPQVARRAYLVAQTSVAVLQPLLDGPAEGPFGWSMRHPISDDEDVREFVAQVVDGGVGFLKYPYQSDRQPQSTTRSGGYRSAADRMIEVMTRLQDQGVITVGRIDAPTRGFDAPSNLDPTKSTGSVGSPPSIGSTEWYSPANLNGSANLTGSLAGLTPATRDVGLANPAYGTAGFASPGIGSGGDVHARGGGVADAYGRPEQWAAALADDLSTITLKVRNWQLGRDDDYSFLNKPALGPHVREIGRQLRGFGQPLRLAIPWPWDERLPDAASITWQSHVRGGVDAMTADELDAMLTLRAGTVRTGVPRPAATPMDAPGFNPATIGNRGLDAVGNRIETWVAMRPAHRDVYSRDDRITDLVRRMAVIRSHRVAAATLTDPHHPDHDVIAADGRPGSLFLPFRTTSRLLGRRRAAGSLRLRRPIQNSVFAGRDDVVWMVWSAGDETEWLYLGDDVREMDVWGRMRPLQTRVTDDGRTEHRLDASAVPRFILGVDPTLLAIRLSTEISPDRLKSMLGVGQRLRVRFLNPTDEVMVGRFWIDPPDQWELDRSPRLFDLYPGATRDETLEVTLSNTATVGRYEVPIHLWIEGNRPRHIVVHRNVRVGPTGLTISASTRLLTRPDSDIADVRVTVEMQNQSDQVQSFDCLLFPPPGRRYQVRFVTLPPGETVRRTFIWNDARDLLGKRLLLRADAHDSPQVLNYPIDITR